MAQSEEFAKQADRGGADAPPSSGSKHGILITLVVLLIVAAVVVGGIVPRLRAKAALKSETYDLAVPTVNVATPKQGAPQTEIVLPGNMQAFTDSPIYARTNGYLKKWYVDIGGRVKAGQLLAEIETPEVDQQLQQARSQLNTAKANYNLAQITSNRYQELKNTDSVAQQDVDNALGAERANAATVSAAEYQVKYLEELESFKNIYAPFDGIITARNTDVGHLINSGAGDRRFRTVSYRGDSHSARVHQRAATIFSGRKTWVDRESDASGISGPPIQGQARSYRECDRSGHAHSTCRGRRR